MDHESGSAGLPGSRELEYVSCCCAPGQWEEAANDALVVTFITNETLEVYKNGGLTKTASWGLVDGAGDIYEIDSDPFVAEIFGRILICDDMVLFNDSYRDGCYRYISKGE